MLRLDVTGDSHPKTFKLVTDDSDAELARFEDILKEIGAEEDDPFRELFSKSADEFAEGVEVPAEIVGDLEDILDMDWPTEADKIRQARAEAAEAAGL